LEQTEKERIEKGIKKTEEISGKLSAVLSSSEATYAEGLASIYCVLNGLLMAALSEKIANVDGLQEATRLSLNEIFKNVGVLNLKVIKIDAQHKEVN